MGYSGHLARGLHRTLTIEVFNRCYRCFSASGLGCIRRRKTSSYWSGVSFETTRQESGKYGQAFFPRIFIDDRRRNTYGRLSCHALKKLHQFHPTVATQMAEASVGHRLTHSGRLNTHDTHRAPTGHDHVPSVEPFAQAQREHNLYCR